MQTTLQALFQSTTTGVVVQDFRSSSVPVTHKYYSRRTLWFGSSRANHSVFTYEEILDISLFFTPILTFSCCSLSMANTGDEVIYLHYFDFVNFYKKV